MNSLSNAKRVVRRVRGWYGLVLLACLLSYAVPAMAGPGEVGLDAGSWMPLDRYDDKVQRFPKQFEKPADAAPADDAAKEVANTSAAPAVEAKQNAPAGPVMAQPSRPLNLAPLPGLNHGFDVRVSTTDDDKDDRSPAQIDNIEDKPELHLSSVNWVDAAAAAKNAAKNAAKGDDDEAKPLDVRLATLPDRSIMPVPMGSVTKPRVKQALKQSLPPAAEKPPAVAAACQALTAFKKRQLAAIESDRKTLAALQAAIDEMGLSKKLDFMTDASSNLNISVGGNAAPMDVPAAAAPTVKN